MLSCIFVLYILYDAMGPDVHLCCRLSVADIAASLQLRKPASLNGSGAGLGAGHQTCLLGSSSLRCEASQQLQQDIQSCNSIWVVLPNSPGVQNFAIAGEATELAVGNAGVLLQSLDACQFVTRLFLLATVCVDQVEGVWQSSGTT